MRKTLPEKLEAGRVLTGPYGGTARNGAYGKFYVHGPCGERLTIVASGADTDDKVSSGWEHVSVSTPRRCPNWQEMCFVKDLFWSEDECVIQFHPPKPEYVNNHPYCLHLWRHRDQVIPMPPSIMVGRKDMGLLTAEQAAALQPKGWRS